MDTLKVSVSWVITSLAKNFETSLHQCTNTTAKNCLLTKQVCLCLCTECSLQNTSSCSADSQCICQCQIQCFACSILLNSYQTWNTFSCLILASYSMSWSFWCDHSNVNVLWWVDASKVNVETMSEHQHIALFQIWLDGLFVHSCLFLIVNQDHDNICFFCCLCCCIYFKSLLLCAFPGSASLIKTDNYMASRFL